MELFESVRASLVNCVDDIGSLLNLALDFVNQIFEFYTKFTNVLELCKQLHEIVPRFMNFNKFTSDSIFESLSRIDQTTCSAQHIIKLGNSLYLHQQLSVLISPL